jgi:hypothetical protein
MKIPRTRPILRAQRKSLRCSSSLIVEDDPAFLPWERPTAFEENEEAGWRWRGDIMAIHEGGTAQFGSKMSVLDTWSAMTPGAATTKKGRRMDTRRRGAADHARHATNGRSSRSSRRRPRAATLPLPHTSRPSEPIELLLFPLAIGDRGELPLPPGRFGPMVRAGRDDARSLCHDPRAGGALPGRRFGCRICRR